MTLKGQLLLVLPLGLVLVFGCGTTKNPNAPASVSGKVTYNGNPVTGGTITFHSKEGRASTIGINAEGSYSTSDIPVGEMVVTVETESANPSATKMGNYPGAKGKAPTTGEREGNKGAMMSPRPPGAGGGGGGYVKIPAKYADKDKSTLRETLSPGTQVKDINLTD